MLYIIGIDPGLGNMGLALLGLDGSLETIACSRTAKEKDLNTSASNLRRGALQAGSLALFHSLAVQRGMKVVAIATEALSLPRNASVAAKIGVAFGVVASFSSYAGIPVFEQSPQRVKKAVCGKLTASKKEMMDAITAKYPEAMWPMSRGKLNKAEAEHIADAVAAALACLQEKEMRMALRMTEAEQKEKHI